MSNWNRIRTDDGVEYYSVGILADGTLWNPNNYPEDAVRAAVLRAEAKRHQRRSNAAKKAGETRRQRRQEDIWAIAQLIAAKQETGPRRWCYVCGRKLDDRASIARGIGSECWQEVLARLTEIRLAQRVNIQLGGDHDEAARRQGNDHLP
jgi:hypothetical protein